MADWTRESDWTSIGSNPAQPAGLTQAAGLWRDGSGPEDPWEGSKAWWGGRNTESTANGWSTEWLAKAQTQFETYQDAAFAAKKNSLFFNWLDPEKNPEATGVALWDDEAKGVRRGDVWTDGVKGDNLYDIMDERSADMMMGSFMFDGKEQARMNKDGDPAGAWRKAVEKVVASNTELALNAESAEDYNQDISDAQRQMQEEGFDTEEALALGAGATAFASAAVPLSALGPAGWVAAGAIGIASGVGAWLNRDQVTEVAARAKVTADRASAEYGAFEGASAWLEGAGKVGMSFLQPGQNWVQGLYDDTRGDGKSRYYEPGEEGKPGWLEPLNLGASLVDSLLTFSSPVSAGAYMATMGAVTVGGGAFQFASDSVMNERTGKFDRIEGLGENVAAWGAWGIDAVQMTQAGALTRAAGSARRAFGVEQRAGQVQGISRPFAPIDRRIDDIWVKRRKYDNVDLDNSITINGIKFFRDSDGVVLGSRATSQILAPSEFVRWLPTGWRARNMRALDEGQTAVDDLYRAALNMTESGSKFGDAVINAYAESVEELVQAYLEPRAVGEKATWDEISRAAMYGATSGFGMSLGLINARPKNPQIEKVRARILHEQRTREGLTDEQWDERWNRMSTAERKRLSIASPEEAEEILQVQQTMTDLLESEDAFNSPFGVMGAQEIRRDAFERDDKNPRVDNTLSLKGRAGEMLYLADGSVDDATYRADEAVMSAWQVVDVMRRRTLGLEGQQRELEKLIERAEQSRDRAQQEGNADQVQRWTEELAKLQDRQNDTDGLVGVSRMVYTRLRGLYNRYRDETDRASAEALLNQFNSILDSAWNGNYTSSQPLTPQQVQMARRAVEFQTTRHPLQDRGSFSILRMRASHGLSRLGSHGSVYTHQSLLKVIGGDHDGDNRVTLSFMYLDPSSRRDMLRGKFAVEVDVDPTREEELDGQSQRREWKLELDRPDGEDKFLSWFSAWSSNPDSDQAGIVNDMIADLKDRIFDAYSSSRNPANPFSEADLVRLTDRLEDDIKAGSPDAVVRFTEDLMNHTPTAYEELHAVGERNNRMELPWLMQQFNWAWDTYSTRISHYNYGQRNTKRRKPAQEQADNAYLQGLSVLRSVNLSRDMNLLFGSDATRNSQHTHYTSTLHAAVKLHGMDLKAGQGQFVPQEVLDLAADYMQLGSGDVESDLDAVLTRDRIGGRVLRWLDAMVAQDDRITDKRHMMMVLANTAVRDIEITGPTEITIRDGEISMLQFLLRRSLQVEEAHLAAVPRDDPQWARLTRLMGMTKAQGPNSYSASQAMLEVFGGFSARDLVGDAADAIGPNVTLNQYMKALIGMDSRERNERFANLRSPATGYMRLQDADGKRKDPPYSAEVYLKGLMNPYSVMIDAMRAVSQNQFKNMQVSSDKTIERLEGGFGAWQKTLEDWRAQFGRKENGRAMDDMDVLDDMLNNAPTQVIQILLDMIPDAARLGVFQIVDGKVYISRWVRLMLLEKNAKRAAKKYYVMTKLEEWRQLQGAALIDENGDIDVDADSGEREDKAVRFEQIKSRFLQTLYIVARDPLGLDLQRFLKLLDDAPDIKSIEKGINENPNWLAGRERLLAFHDDVAEFESNPADVWSANLPGQAQREAIKGWGEKIGNLGVQAVRHTQNRTTERNTLSAMQAVLDRMPNGRFTSTTVPNVSNQDVGYQNLVLLDLAIKNRLKFPDTIGINSREQYFRAVQEGLIQMHNKGTADDRVAPMGEPLALTEAWGAKQGLPRELDSITVYDFDAIMSNPTELVRRPVNVMMPNGSVTMLDFTTVEGALKHLQDPRTNALAKAVLFPIVRDVNTQNVPQMYLDTEDTTDLTKMLQEQTLVHIFEWKGAGDRPTLEQAYRYIGMIEAHTRGASRTKSKEEQQDAQFPIMNMIDDFLVAYYQGVPVGGQDLDKMRTNLIIDVAVALRRISKVAPGDKGENIRALQKELVAMLRDRYYKGDQYARLQRDTGEQLIEHAVLLKAALNRWRKELRSVEKKLASGSTRGAKRQALEDRADELNNWISEIQNTEQLSLHSPEFRSLEQIHSLYNIDWNGSKRLQRTQKKALIDLLANNGNVRPFRDKKTMLLIDKILKIAHEKPHAVYDDITRKEWNQVVGWAIETMVRDETGRPGSSFAGVGTIIDPDTGRFTDIAKYFDRSFSTLADQLFEPQILDAIGDIRTATKDEYFLSKEEVREGLLFGLFNQERFGEWTEQVPIESIKYRKVLGGAPVGLAVAVAGSDPVAFADYVGGSILTTKKPESQHFSTAVFESDDVDAVTLRHLLNRDPMQMVKLQNHFVRSIKITSKNPDFAQNNPNPEFLGRVGHVNIQTPEVENSGLRVLHLSDLTREVERLRDQGLTDFRIEIEYVDVDKKPWDREWRHNLYFDGVGREASSASTRGPVASLVFALGALSKYGQQQPLNFATKGGSAYGMYTPTDPEIHQEIQRTSTSVTEYMSRMGLHLWGIDDYDTGAPLASDLPSLYKLVKMRHVIEVTDPQTGAITLHWPEDIIYQEQAGTAPAWNNMRIVPLSDRVARTLWGTSGFEGVDSALTPPVLNLMDIDSFPSLDRERLERLGLNMLGLRVEPGDTAFARAVLPGRATVAPDTRGTPRKQVWEAKERRWADDQKVKFDERAVGSRPGVTNFDPNAISKSNDRRFAEMVSSEEAAGYLMRLGIPFASIQDMTRTKIAKAMSKLLRNFKTAPDQAVTWMHIQDGGKMSEGKLIPGYNLTKGILTGAETDAGLQGPGLSNLGPTFGDIVVLDLDSFLRATAGNRTQAFANIRKVITTYADRGVTIALASAKGDQYFRGDIVDWMDSGSLGYTSVANNRHIFVPATSNTWRGRDALAMESADFATGVITPKHVTFALMSDLVAGTSGSENASYTDYRHDPQWRRTSAVIFPSAMMRTSPDARKEHLFNIPVGDRQRDQVGDALRPLLRTPEGIDYLTKLFRDKDGNTEPPDSPRYRENAERADGTRTIDPGIVYLEDALTRLLERLDAGIHPLDDLEVLMMGDIVPLVDLQGNIVLQRHGFDPLKPDEMDRQFAQPGPGTTARAGKIAASSTKFSTQTITPPMKIMRTYPDPRRGLVLEGEWDMDAMSKLVWEGLGFKSGGMPLPDNWEMPGSLSRKPGNNIRITQLLSQKAPYGKAAVDGVVDNFRDAFAAFGIDLRPYLVDYFFGKDKSRSQADTDQKWTQVKNVLDKWSQLPHNLTQKQASSLLNLNNLAGYAKLSLTNIFQQETGGLTPKFSLEVESNKDDTAEAQLVRIVLATLTQPRVRLEHIVSTSGLTTVDNNGDITSKIVQMPTFFTDALDNSTQFPKLRKALFKNINSRFPLDANGETQFLLTESWDFYAKIIKKGEGPNKSDLVDWKPSKLAYILPLPASENPAGLTQSGIGRSQDQTQHVTNVINAAAGGRISIDPKIKKDKEGNEYYPPTHLEQVYNNRIWRPGQDGETFYQMLTRINPNDTSYSPYPRRLPVQDEYLDTGASKRRQYRQEIDTSDDKMWDESKRTRYQQKQDEILNVLGLTNFGESMREEVDYLVRQFAGRPGPSSDQDSYVGAINGDTAIQIADLILTNLRNFVNPLHGGAVFVPDRHFMQTVYKAQESLPAQYRWAPLRRDGKRRVKAQNWDQWVDSLLGHFRDSNQEMRAMFISDIDGFFHTWHQARPGLGDLPMSYDVMRNARLMHAPSNDALLAQDPAYDPRLSLDPGRDAIIHDPIILDTMKQTLDTLIGHKATFDSTTASDAYASPLKEQLDKQKAWLASHKLAKQKRLRTKDYMAEGAYYTNTVEYQNRFMKNLVNLSLTMRLANPALWVSALMEVPVRNALEHVTNAITGSNISGTDRMARRMPSKYTPEEVTLLRNLSEQLGQRKEWLALLYDEMTYQQLVEGHGPGAGAISKGLEKAASFTARATSDPRYGMKATSVARRYIEAAMEYFTLTGTAISVEQFVAEMSNNPMWLRDMYESAEKGNVFNPHRSGMNRVAQVRSTKQTLANKIAFGWIDTMTTSPSAMANISGHLLKIPFMFTRFNVNALMTMTGVTAFDQAAAMFFDKRGRPAFMRKAGQADTWDFADIIETIDLHRTFVRSGMTYSMLMTLGLMAGNLGIGGDDEEERRRERLAKNLGLPHYRDPRDAANDFRLADAYFLESFPFLGGHFADDKGNAVVVPHWIIKQFTSPIIGMQRFFDTGDLREIRDGFLDAFSAFPNSFVQLWDRADVTAMLLAEQAAEEAAKGTNEGMANTNSMLISIVGIYERAIFENWFGNSIRNALDPYDRNPYAIPGIDPSTGEIARFPGTNTPMSQEEALVAFRNEDDEIQQAFMSRQGRQGELYQYAENNLSFALLASLFTGLGDSPFLRRNMVPREQVIERPDVSQAEVEALVFSAYRGAGGQPPMNKLEIIQMLKQRDQDAGKFWNQSSIEEEAEALMAAQQDQVGALATLDAEAREVLTQAGQESVFWSLANGVIEIGDKALDGFSASYEVREAISEEWGQRLLQEGLDLGLSYESAVFRANRFWYGADGVPGLGDILWDKKIPYNNDLEYFQLNHTYTVGPDGKPWATPFPKMGLLQAAGLPIATRMGEAGTGLSLDEHGNIVDEIAEINTGLAGLERKPDLAIDIDRNDDAFKKGIEKADAAASNSRKFGYTPWRRYGRGGGGGGGGGYARDMRAFPGGTSPRFDGIQMLNSNNPYIRRANVNRLKIWSERGRLKQWQ